MSCLVTAPTAKEIAPFIDYLKNNATKLPVDVLITGVGLTNTVYHLVKQINLKKPSIMIQAGVAGCFDKKMQLGIVVTVSQDVIADSGVIEKGKHRSLFDLGFEKPDKFPFLKGWLRNSNRALLDQNSLQPVKGITVNRVSTGSQAKRMIKKFDPVTETLEGAAFHYVAIMEKIPFLQLRGLSNYIGERDKRKWRLKEAIGNLNYELIRLLEKL
jgi:futalosine hydrolase